MRLKTLLLCLAPMSAVAAPELHPPIDCDLRTTCHIQQFLDHDPGPDSIDFRCGAMTYDGHKGTDFALPDLAAMRAGVAVIAAADGVVSAVRDGMEDVQQDNPAAPDVTGRECGNGVVIVHTDGIETQYCHMRRGTVAVSEGDTVAQGTVLGQVGLSGNTGFPHLHFSVRRDGLEIDPFAPELRTTCGETEDTLWAEPLPAPTGGLVAAGFATSVPEFDAIKDSAASPEVLPTTIPALVLWGHAFASQPGDQIEIAFSGPEGETFSHVETLDKGQARVFRAAGRRSPSGGWPAGPYTGNVTLTRGEEVIDTIRVTVVIGD